MTREEMSKQISDAVGKAMSEPRSVVDICKELIRAEEIFRENVDRMKLKVLDQIDKAYAERKVNEDGTVVMSFIIENDDMTFFEVAFRMLSNRKDQK